MSNKHNSPAGYNSGSNNTETAAASTKTLTLQPVAIDTYHENVAYLHRDCEIYRAEGFQALSRIEVSDGETSILTVLNVVDGDRIIQPGQLGLSEQAFKQLGLPAGHTVHIAHAEPPASMQAVRRKIAGHGLNRKNYLGICRDIAGNRYSKMEMASFLVACGQSGMERNEVLYLTEAMLATGDRLSWDADLVADKHCIGGIPGNRTSMIVVPIIAAHGMMIPKTSSRAITSPSGTADTMEVLAQTRLPVDELRHIVEQDRGCIAWGGTANLAPVDDRLISVERPLAIDSAGQMVASILSKKLAAGSTNLLIDIPVGPTAKVHHPDQAMRLRKLFEFVGDELNLHLEVLFTDGRQPVGRGIGPVLEARDVIQVLENQPDAPIDLRQKSLLLAGRILEFDPDVRGGQGYVIARDILDSGRALKKMRSFIQHQGEQTRTFSPGKLTRQICADRDGYITGIDNLQLSRIARLAGAPMDKGAGVDLYKKLGDEVASGEPVYCIFAEFPADFQFATDMSLRDCGVRIGNTPDQTPGFME